MKKSISRIIGVIMLIVAIAFIIFALNHPEKSFLWSNRITWLLYGVYFLVTIVLLASLALLMKNACKIFILPIFVHKADDYAVKGNSKGVARMHMLGGFLYLNLPYGIFVFLAFLLGNTVIQSVLDAIPQFVKSGLTIATGLMPALGFAVLASMIINKKNWYFLLLGFLISAYMGMSVTGVALFATVIALIIVNMQNNQVITATEMGGDEDDDF